MIEKISFEIFISNLLQKAKTESPHSLTHSCEIAPWILQNQHLFKNFMYELFNASLHLEEGRQVCLRVALAQHPTLSDINFKKPLKFEAKSLVKIAPTINLWDRQLLVKPNSDGKLEITGFLQNIREKWDSIISRDGKSGYCSNFITVEIHGPGEIRVNAPFDREYRKGESGAYTELQSLPVIDEFCIKIAKQINNWKEKPNDIGTPLSSNGLTEARFFIATLMNILKYMREGKHGGTIAFVPSPKELWENEIVIKDYEIESEYLIDSMKKRYLKSALKRSLHPRFQVDYVKRRTIFEMGSHTFCDNFDVADSVDDLHFSERELERAEQFVASLTYVDGAVVITDDLQLVGFGARFVSKECQNTETKNVGMRHKSARDFCCAVPGAIAIVVSQDGGITVFSNESHGSYTEDHIILDYLRSDS